MSTAIPYSTKTFLPIFFKPFDLILVQKTRVKGLKAIFSLIASAWILVTVSRIVAIAKRIRMCFMSYVENNQATAAVKKRYALLHFKNVRIADPTSAKSWYHVLSIFFISHDNCLSFKNKPVYSKTKKDSFCKNKKPPRLRGGFVRESVSIMRGLLRYLR